jgi:hypothetical protein
LSVGGMVAGNVGTVGTKICKRNQCYDIETKSLVERYIKHLYKGLASVPHAKVPVPEQLVALLADQEGKNRNNDQMNRGIYKIATEETVQRNFACFFIHIETLRSDKELFLVIYVCVYIYIFTLTYI